jgi:membrane protease YdiL (CAAX protease family)
MRDTPPQPVEKRKPMHLLAFLASFFVLWTLRALLFDVPFLAQQPWDDGLRILIWLFFPMGWLLIDTGSIGEALDLQRAFSHRWAALLSAVLIYAVPTYYAVASAGHRHAMPDRIWDYVVATNGPLLVGSVEEFVFRGIVMGELWRRHGFWIANLASALLFVLIHWPGWIALGHLPPMFLMTFSARVFVFGLVMGIIVGLEGNVRWAIVLHSLNDFLLGAAFR